MHPLKRSIPWLALVALGACASVQTPPGAPPAPPSAETIAVSVGPCFGFCPVYTVSVTPNGGVRFTGERHTAVLGERERVVSPALYRSLAADLAAFRPASGTTAQVPCDAQISDTSSYTVTWTNPTGSTTTAQHQGHCPSGTGQALDALLRDLPERLGIAAWAKQTSRPGASRG
jgi:hypothetical protein